MPTAALVLALGLSLAPPADPTRDSLLRAGYSAVPLLSEKNAFYVECEVLGEKTKFLLDTGVAAAHIDLALAKKLKLTLGDEYPGLGLGGKTAGRLVEFPSPTVGGYNMANDTNTWAAVAEDLSGMPNGIGGVIGTNVLEMYSAVIDYPARTLHIRSPLNTVWPVLEGKWTATNWSDEDKPRKLDPKTAPTFEFADGRVTLTDGESAREYAIYFVSDGDTHTMVLFDPKDQGKADQTLQAGGLVKFGQGTMTTCMIIDRAKLKKPVSLPTEFATPPGSGFSLIEWKATAPGKPRPDPLRDPLTKAGYTAVPMPRDLSGWRVVSAGVGKRDLRLAVDTGAGVTGFDAAVLAKVGGDKLGGAGLSAFGGRVEVETRNVRGLRVGGYDARTAWAVALVAGVDVSGFNKPRAEHKLKPVDGFLGDFDLRNGSAVLDLGTDTLYLRPLKDTLWPKLQGQWVAVAWEYDGVKGKYRPEDQQAVVFADGKLTFDVPGKKVEWGFHLRDEGELYGKGLGAGLTRFALFDPKADATADGFAYVSGGLIHLDGDRLTMLTVQDAQKVKEDPISFAAAKGNGLVQVEYTRAK